MNGCELPGNVVLKVEPSDPLHKKQRTTSESNNTALQHDKGLIRQDQNTYPGTSHNVGLSNSSSKNDDRGRSDPTKQQFDQYQHDNQAGKGQKDNNYGPAEEEEDDLDGFFASLE